MWNNICIFLIIVADFIAISRGNECVSRDFGAGSIVCVCNATYCDSVPKIIPPRGQFSIYESGKSGKRLAQNIDNFSNDTTLTENMIFLDPGEQYQVMDGFGGALTDSTGINIRNLSDAAQEHLMEAYFGANGSAYRMVRLPIGGTDFSTRPYTLDDHPNDVSLQKFELSDEDHEYRIPLIRRARELSPTLKAIAAAWTAPPWMKTNDNYTGFGFLKKEFYQAYANYLTRYLTEYHNLGLPVSGISTGNEPGNVDLVRFNSMGWTPQKVADFLANNLGPAIAASPCNETVIAILDDTRNWLPAYVEEIFKNPTAENYTYTIGLHWYTDEFISPEVLDVTHNKYPNKFMLLTEGCVGNYPLYDRPVILGDWSRAERYILGLIQNLNHWVIGYVDRNLALNMEGGPNWAENYADSPIIVDAENDEFYKQPTYYAIAHFSKFVLYKSRRIKSTNIDGINNVAFLSPQNEVALIMYNGNNETKTVYAKDPDYGTIMTNIPPYSVQTVIYQR